MVRVLYQMPNGKKFLAWYDSTLSQSDAEILKKDEIIHKIIGDKLRAIKNHEWFNVANAPKWKEFDVPMNIVRNVAVKKRY